MKQKCLHKWPCFYTQIQPHGNYPIAKRCIADELHLLWCRLTQVDCNVLAICIHLQIRKQLLAKLSRSKSDWRQLRITIQPTASHSMSSAVALQSKTVPQRLRVLHMQPLLNQLFFRNYLQIIAEPQFFPFLVSMRLLFCFYSLIYIYIILYYIIFYWTIFKHRYLSVLLLK